MRATLALLLVFSAMPAERARLLSECFATAAYEVIKAQAAKPSDPAVCCGKCNGTGKVRSGDGLSIVPCPCPPDCRCKKGGGK